MRTVTVEFDVDADNAQHAVNIVEDFIPSLRSRYGQTPLGLKSWAVVCVREVVPRVLRVEDGKVQED